jgi:hypothetical protein
MKIYLADYSITKENSLNLSSLFYMDFFSECNYLSVSLSASYAAGQLNSSVLIKLFNYVTSIVEALQH